MKAFPFLTDYVNRTFESEKRRLDYIFLRPLLQVLYFFLRIVLFPLKYLVHRTPHGFEGRCIDGVLAFGMKYFATIDAVEMVVRHVQIEPLLYRHLLAENSRVEATRRKFNGIGGDYDLDSLSEMIRNNLTIGRCFFGR